MRLVAWVRSAHSSGAPSRFSTGLGMTENSPLDGLPILHWLNLDLFERDPVAMLARLGLPPFRILAKPLEQALRILLNRDRPLRINGESIRPYIDRALVSDSNAFEAAVALIVLEATSATSEVGFASNDKDSAIIVLRMLPEIIADWMHQGQRSWSDLIDLIDASPLLAASAVEIRSALSNLFDVHIQAGTTTYRPKFLDALPFEIDLLDLAAIGVLLGVDFSVRSHLAGDTEAALLTYNASALAGDALTYFSGAPQRLKRLIESFVTATDVGRQRGRSAIGARRTTQDKQVRWAYIKSLALPLLHETGSEWTSVERAAEKTLEALNERLRTGFGGEEQLHPSSIEFRTYKEILKQIRIEEPTLFRARRQPN
jgi:hypothetical protein